MKMTTSTRNVGNVAIVDIHGDIVFGEESAALHNLVNDLIAQGRPLILLNLRAVNHMDSMGMGALVGASASVRKQGGELRLLNLSSKVADVMQITKLYTVFDIYEDEPTAVASFNKSSAAQA